jgi:hypothetical protein
MEDTKNFLQTRINIVLYRRLARSASVRLAGVLINAYRKTYSLFLYCNVSPCVVRAATLAEVFPCFFLSCKAKTGHGSHFPNY